MRVDKISFAGSNGVNSNSVVNTGGHSPVLNYADDSFESASKAVKHNSGIKKFFTKAMMGLGVVGLGLGAQACDPTDTPIDPPVNPPTKTELSETQKGFMAVMSDVTGAKFKDGEMLDSAYVKETDSQGKVIGYNAYKVDRNATTQDTIVYKLNEYGSEQKNSEVYNVKAYRNKSTGNIETKTYNAYKDFLGTTEFSKDGQSTIEALNKVKLYKLTPNGVDVDKLVLANGIKRNLKNLFYSVK